MTGSTLTTAPRTACHRWCDPAWCVPGIRHCSAPVVIDATDVECHLSLRQWLLDRETALPHVQPPRLVLIITHKIELAEAPGLYDGELPLSMCASLDPGEARALVEAQRQLLGMLDEAVGRDA